MNNNLARHLHRQAYLRRDVPEKHRGYIVGAWVVSNADFKISTGVQAQLRLKGVGDSIAAEIDRYLQAHEPHLGTKDLNDLMTIIGIGPITAQYLYSRGVRLANIHQYQHWLTREQRLGFVHRADVHLLVPHNESQMLLEKLRQSWSSQVAPHNVQVKGAFARDKLGSNVNVAIFGQYDARQLVRHLTDLDVVAVITNGKKASRWLVRIKPRGKVRRVDIRVFPDKVFGSLHSTGSKHTNQRLRATAKGYNMTLNEYGLGPDFNVHSTHDVFRALHVPYVTPRRR